MITPTPDPLFAIAFISWDLLFRQIAPCLSSLLIGFIAISIARAIDFNHETPNLHKLRTGELQGYAEELEEEKEDPELEEKQRRMDREVEKALAQRQAGKRICPYCKQTNLLSDISCHKCGAPL